MVILSPWREISFLFLIPIYINLPPTAISKTYLEVVISSIIVLSVIWCLFYSFISIPLGFCWLFVVSAAAENVPPLTSINVQVPTRSLLFAENPRNFSSINDLVVYLSGDDVLLRSLTKTMSKLLRYCRQNCWAESRIFVFTPCCVRVAWLPCIKEGYNIIHFTIWYIHAWNRISFTPSRSPMKSWYPSSGQNLQVGIKVAPQKSINTSPNEHLQGAKPDCKVFQSVLIV